MLGFLIGVLVTSAVAYWLHTTSAATLKADVSLHVSTLEKVLLKVEPVVKTELVAVVDRIKSLL